ncbi:MAG: pantetheine-phosphate adenylyltransferase [Bacteroidia bacterium]|nr:pantetheine-phosphate adenylyltransferase [Bacteroidia bacterium]
MKIAIFPGSFDPVTLGHEEIIEKGLALFDKLIIGVGVNSQKKTMFSEAERLAQLQAAFGHHEQLQIEAFEGLTVEFAQQKGARFLLRGLRNGQDLEYEKTIALINKELVAEIETVFVLSSGQFSHLSSTLVREVIKYKGNISNLVPPAVANLIYPKPN